MNKPLIIISYWFAPSPAVGAKRFSFLAREFAHLQRVPLGGGFPIHVARAVRGLVGANGIEVVAPPAHQAFEFATYQGQILVGFISRFDGRVDHGLKRGSDAASLLHKAKGKPRSQPQHFLPVHAPTRK